MSTIVSLSMSRAQTLSIKTIADLCTADGLYLFAFSWLFGQTIWVSFIGGVIAHRSLTRQQFAALQSRSFPAYFLSSTALCTILLGLWTFSHPDVVPNLLRPLYVDVAQAYILLFVSVVQGANYLVIGPETNRIVAERQRLEREEGKSYNDPAASPAMKAVNKEFGKMHGLSSLMNLFVVIALGLHALWIGNHGLRSY